MQIDVSFLALLAKDKLRLTFAASAEREGNLGISSLSSLTQDSNTIKEIGLVSSNYSFRKDLADSRNSHD